MQDDLSLDRAPARRVQILPPGRGRVALVVLFAAIALLLLVAPDVLLTIFGGLLFAVFFGGGGGWLARRTGIPRGWAIGLFVLGVVLALAGAVTAFAPEANRQFDALVAEVPDALSTFRDRLEDYTWGEAVLRHATPAALMSNGGGGTTVTAVMTTFGALGSFVIMLFIGLYVALDPRTYRRGLVALLAPSLRDDGNEVLGTAADALSNWLVAQLMSMTVVGVLTWLGLWLIGIPLAPILGLIAALFAFIPNIGPILAALPAILLGFADSPTTAALVAGVYVAVQTLESYFITPLIQQERVSLPPALIISTQLLMGALFGLPGLALATPMAALGLALTREVYVRRYLGAEDSAA